MQRQHTLASSVHVQGIGLHTGQPAAVEVCPAPPNSGIQFVQRGNPDGPSIVAHHDQVVDTRLSTTLGNGTWKVSMVEHLLAALLGESIDNVTIILDGPEVPVLDGSAAVWVERFSEVGRREQQVARRFLVMLREIEVAAGESRASLAPCNVLELSAHIAFPHPAIGEQKLSVQIENGTFRDELAWARTFGFLAEAEYLQRAGLALGASLDNAVVYDETGVMNDDGLRGEAEAVRHKMLDMMGDLALAGLPIRGRFSAVRACHALNQALLSALFSQPDAWVIEDG